MAETIPDLLHAIASARPSHVAVLGDQPPLTLAELNAGSSRFAAALAMRGIGKGDRVALYCINCVEFVTAYFGIVKAGAVVVPVNLLIAAGEIAYVLEDAGVAALVYHAAMQEAVSKVRAISALPACQIVIGGDPVGSGVARFSDLVREAGSTPEVALDPSADLAAILYTSGTTGQPKGAMLTHANLAANTRSVARALELKPGEDRLLVVLPMFHSFAATVGMLTPVLHGASLVPVPKFEPGLVTRMVSDYRATVFLGVPSMYGVILRLPDEQAAQWRSVRCGVSGGAAMPVNLIRQFEARFGFPILEGDGPTECSPVTCVNPPSGVRKPGSVGLPVPNVDIEIFDDAGQPVPCGEIGELCVRGPSVMKGYWRRPEATAEVFFGDWLRTGDLGYKDPDGYLFMVDRMKDMIIVNGMNVYPRMVEEILYTHPQILEAAVVGEPHASHGEIVVAYVVPRAPGAVDEAAIKAFCHDNLGRHQRPRKVILREQLPKNATGKILKRELRRAGEVERGVVDQG